MIAIPAIVMPVVVSVETRQVTTLRQQLDTKAEEMAGVGMVMVHDLLVLTNDFLADLDRADGERGGGRRGSKESLFEKMVTEEQRQREKRVRPGRELPIVL